jgi:hypothetical protein
MDTTKEKSELENLFASFNAYGVDNTGAVSGAIDTDNTMIYSSTGLTDTITLSPTWSVPSSNITIGSSIPNITVANGAYTTSAFGNVWGAGANSGQLDLTGDNADIKINGKSLVATLEALEHRLNILTPNPQLESEWDELRELGERYRALEKQCEEKAAMWAKLKSMPPPDIT